ncbi:MAG: type II toxin-antitoxin system ParD family antitoxin [Pirellulaceae bacterium]|nr:type II toxin-antitoxin system ParD family antitoxin [Pirellulaceae bacterium]
MNVELTPDDQTFVEERIRSGRYENAADVVHQALTLMRLTPRSLDDVRAMVDTGLEQLDRGEGTPWNGEEIKAEGRRRLDEIRKKW